MPADVDKSEWDAWNARVSKLLGSDYLPVMRKAGNRAGAAFDERVKTELPPAVRRKKVARYWTAKQRRWWWATMHAKAQGKSQALPGWKAVYRTKQGRKTLVLSGSYKRTGTIVRTLTWETVQTPNETLVLYGTNRKAAKYVLDKTHQSKYHAGNWAVLQDLAARYEPDVLAEFQRTAQREIDKRLGI